MSLFSQPIQKSVIEQAIADLEKKTSAELRVYVERKKADAGRSALQQATFLFQQLEMEKTALRNGVLIYLALQEYLLLFLA